MMARMPEVIGAETMNNLLTPTRVNGDKFAWSKNRGVTEISTLGPDFDFSRVWNDACDEGLTIVSHKTGREIVFAINNTRRDADNDVVAWELTSVSPKFHGISLVIFND
jgi:hypothetical protein